MLPDTAPVGVLDGAPPMSEPEPATPPQLVLIQKCAEYLTAGLFLQVGKLGIPDLLADGPRSVDELAGETQVDPDALYRVLRMLAASGVFSEVSPRMFRQTPASNALRICRFARVFLELPRILQTRRSGFQLAFGVSDWDYLDRHPAEGALFNRAQALLHAPLAEAVVAAYDWSGVSRVLDLGGGTGGLISAILIAKPHLSGLLLERSTVVPAAHAAIAHRGLANRCEVGEVDFLDRVPHLDADVVILSQIIHDWDDESAVTILRNTRASMRAGDRLVLVEAVVPPGDTPHPSKFGDVMMLAFTRGRERTEDEYRDLLARAGLRLARIVDLPPTTGGTALIEAVIAS